MRDKESFLRECAPLYKAARDKMAHFVENHDDDQMIEMDDFLAPQVQTYSAEI